MELKPYLGQHWRRKNLIGPEYILNGGDNWHLGPKDCTYELVALPPGDPFVTHCLPYAELTETYEPIY